MLFVIKDVIKRRKFDCDWIEPRIRMFGPEVDDGAAMPGRSHLGLRVITDDGKRKQIW